MYIHIADTSGHCGRSAENAASDAQDLKLLGEGDRDPVRLGHGPLQLIDLVLCIVRQDRVCKYDQIVSTTTADQNIKKKKKTAWNTACLRSALAWRRGPK